METLEVVAAYTLTADGQRHDVAPDRIYTQESYSSATAPLYADRKVRVIVFSNLAPGSRVVYELRRTQNTPYFPTISACGRRSAFSISSTTPK